MYKKLKILAIPKNTVYPPNFSNLGEGIKIENFSGKHYFNANNFVFGSGLMVEKFLGMKIFFFSNIFNISKNTKIDFHLSRKKVKSKGIFIPNQSWSLSQKTLFFGIKCHFWERNRY